MRTLQEDESVRVHGIYACRKRTLENCEPDMAKGARSAVVLGECREGEIWKDIAYAYGRNLGIALQVRWNP